jgi:hypothetical protein
LGLNNVAIITKKTEALFEAITKKPFRFAGCAEFLQQMLKFQLMGKPDIDDGSEYATAIDDEPPDNDPDADFDDGSDDEKKPASKPSSKPSSQGDGQQSRCTHGKGFETSTWTYDNQGSKGSWDSSNKT